MTVKQKLWAGAGVYVGGVVLIVALTGWHRTNNTAFQPQNEFKLDTWFSLGPIDFNKAVMYLIVAAFLTCVTMNYVAKRMTEQPNRVQTLVETIYGLMRDNITRGNMDDRMAAKWFPFVSTLFLFILFSKLIGYIPLPTNT